MSDDAPSTLDPDEPHTPAWFSFLGLGLFLLAGIFFLVRSGEEEEASPGAPGAALDGGAPTPGGRLPDGPEPAPAD